MRFELVALTTFSILLEALALPHGRGLFHHHGLLHKRDYVTKVAVQTIYAPKVIVYVDENGKTLSTVTAGAPAATPTPEQPYPPPANPEPTPIAEPPPSEQPPAPVSSKEVPPPQPPPSQSQPSGPAESAPSYPPTSKDDFPMGIAYTPYTTGACKDADAILKDFQKMSGYDLVRIYGTDCDQVRNAVAAATKTNKKLMLGVYDLAQVDTEVDRILAQAGDFSRVQAITVGNEAIKKAVDSGQSPQAAVGQVLAGLKVARQKLAGKYKGVISTVDTVANVLQYPALCENSDVTMANCHAYWDPNTDAAHAGDFVTSQVGMLRNKCGGNKRVVITESGWPSSGAHVEAPGGSFKGVASKADQTKAIASLRSSFKSNMVLFSAFDEAWKARMSGTGSAEPHWGILS